MNVFQSFQPKKQNVIDTSALQDAPQETKVGGFKSLMSLLDDDVLGLSISSSSLAVKSAASEVAQTVESRTSYRLVESSDIKEAVVNNPVPYRSVTVEANFDLRVLLGINQVMQDCDDLSCTYYVYPNHSFSPLTNRIAEQVVAELRKPRHWVASETVIPNLHSTNARSTVEGSSFMTGTASAAGTRSNASGGSSMVDEAVSVMESRLLKWQSALHALLRRLLSSDSTTRFHVLGRSALVPANASGSSSSSESGSSASSALPYTSALFYDGSHSEKALHHGAATAQCEPVCILLGVHKPLLARLQQLGARCFYLEDINSPLPLSKADMASQGKSAVISIAHNKTSIDPHASTAAQFRRNKLGVDLLVRGRLDVTIAAQVVNESVFNFLHTSNRTNELDVPILAAWDSFPHATAVRCEVRPVQCQYQFSDDVSKRSSSSGSSSAETTGQERGAPDKRDVQRAAHTVQLTGLIAPSYLPSLIDKLHNLRAQQKVNAAAAQKLRRKVTSAYDYLRRREEPSSSNSAKDAKQAAIPALVPLGPSRTSSAAAVVAAPLNPMRLVVVDSLRYDASETESEEEGSGDEQGDAKVGAREDTTAIDAALSSGISSVSRVDGQRNGARKRAVGSEADVPNTSTSAVFTGKRSRSAAVGSSTALGTPLVSGLRMEEWLRQRREEAHEASYFHIHCTVGVPRMAHLSYANSATHGEYEAAVTADPHGVAQLPAVELVEEVRWTSQLGGLGNFPSVGDGNNGWQVEVVTTLRPPARVRPAVPVDAHKKDGAGAEEGMVLDALNKYTIYADVRVV